MLLGRHFVERLLEPDGKRVRAGGVRARSPLDHGAQIRPARDARKRHDSGQSNDESPYLRASFLALDVGLDEVGGAPGVAVGPAQRPDREVPGALLE